MAVKITIEHKCDVCGVTKESQVQTLSGYSDADSIINDDDEIGYLPDGWGADSDCSKLYCPKCLNKEIKKFGDDVIGVA